MSADFAFPNQSEPAPMMPFEALTGNSRRSDATVIHKTTPVGPEDKENAQAPVNVAEDKQAKPSPYTPAHAAKPIRMVQPGPVADDLPSMAELLAWKNPAASICAMLFGTATLSAASLAFSRTAPFLSGASTLLGVMLALNFVRSTFSATWLKHSAWSGSSFETLLINRSKDVIAFAMMARDQLCCSDNPWVMLGTCISLAVVRNIAYYTNFWSLMAICWTLAFVITPTRSTLGSVLSWLHVKSTGIRQYIAGKARKTWSSLDRLSKVCCIAISALAAAYVSDATSKGFLVLTFLMFVRCSMKAKEVKAVRESTIVRSVASSHVLRSAFRATERAGSFADDVLMSAMKSARKQLGAHDE